MLWRTCAITVALPLATVSTVASHDSISDQATLTLQGTVSSNAVVSIRSSDGARVVDAATNTPGGLSLSLELASGGYDSSFMIDDAPARFEDGFAHLADVRRGAPSDASGAVAIAYVGSDSPLLVLDVAAR